MYDPDGRLFIVYSFTYLTNEKRWIVSGYFDHFLQFLRDNTDRFSIAPPDSWEKLEDDAEKSPCRYYIEPHGMELSCSNYPKAKDNYIVDCDKIMRIDLIKRAKRLAGIEEEEDK